MTRLPVLLTVKSAGSAPSPTLVLEYGTTFSFTFYYAVLRSIQPLVSHLLYQSYLVSHLSYMNLVTLSQTLILNLLSPTGRGTEKL